MLGVAEHLRHLRTRAARKQESPEPQGNELTEEKTINFMFHVSLNFSCN